MGFLSSIFSQNDLTPHGFCLLWRPELIWLDAGSDALIALSYYSIPIALLVILSRRRDLAFGWMLGLFAAFILACGTTHWLDAVTLWYPDYTAQALAKLVTAALSLATAIIAWPMLPRILALPSPDTLQRLNAQLQEEVAERTQAERALRELNNALDKQVEARTAELRLAAEELATANQNLSAIFDACPLAIIGRDAHGVVTICNAAAESIYGISAAKMIGSCEFSSDAIREYIDALMRGQSIRERSITSFNRLSGATINLRLTGAPIYKGNGEIAGIISLSEDVTEEAQTAAQLQQSEERYRNLVDNMVEAVIMINEDGLIQEFNKAAERLTGYTRADVLGKNVSLLLPSDLRASHGQYIRHYRTTGEARIIGIGRDVEACRNDGVLIPVRLAVSECWSGGQLYFTGTLEDLSARRALEREKERIEDQLRQAQKMQVIGQIAGGVAHDFNNLLNVITLTLELIGQMVAGDTTEVPVLVTEALTAALRGAEITKHLLAFARRQPLNPKPLNVNDVLTRVWSLLQRVIGEQIESELRLAAGLWPVYADETQLTAALTNLATNARDAMSYGGSLTLTAFNTTLDAGFAQDSDVVPGEYVAIEVRDTGTGMAVEVIDQIFEPFFTTKPVGEGTGLGLSMVFGFMKQSRGHVTVESAVGQGTCFRLYLPRALEAAASLDTTSTPVPIVQNEGVTILLVDDDDGVRRAVSFNLTTLGYRVVTAANAAEAIEILHDERVDLLFSDVVMPGKMDGLDLNCYAQQHWPQLRTILVSGNPEARRKLEGSQAGMQLLVKPYRQAELIQALNEALARPVTTC
ncbi:MAG: PAS domain S-box protein [Alphaproteobacteria bacterium]|nr:PAS domain S-box protein [Alphaproteobacteria bacterium]